MFNVGSVQGYLKLNTSGWNTPMRTATSGLNQLSRTFMRMGAVATGALVLIEREFGRFDKAIRHATSVSDTTMEQFDQMSRMALDASVRWNKSATNTAQAFYYLGSAGLTVTEQMQAFNDTIMLSRAMGSELSQTVEGMVDITRAFNLEFADSRIIADQLTKTVISSNQHFRDLDQALSYGASTARLTNNTLADTAAMLGVMANAGIKGSMAGTVLRRALTNLMSPTREMAGLIYEMGLNIYDSTGRMKPFIQIMGEISDKLKNASDEYKNMVFEVLFGRRAIAGQIVLFDYGSEALKKYAEEIENAGGTTERVANKQMKAFTEQLGRLWQEMRRLSIMAGELLAPSIERLGDYIRSNISAVEAYVEANKEAVTHALKWTAVFGAVFAIGTPLMLLMAGLAKQMVALATVIANPFVALIAALYTFRAVWKQTTEEIKRTMWTGAKNSMDSWVSTMVYALSSGLPPTARMNFIRSAGGFLGWESGSPGGRGGKNKGLDLKQVWDEAYDAVQKQMKIDMGDFSDLLSGTLADIPSLSNIKQTIQDILTLFTTKPSRFYKDIAKSAEMFNERLKVQHELWKKNHEVMSATGKQTGYLAGAWQEALRNIFRPPVGTGATWGDAFTSMLNNVQQSWANTIEDMISKGGNLKDFMENMFLSVINSLNQMVSQIIASDLLYAATGRGGRTAGMPSTLDFIRSLGTGGGKSSSSYYTPGLSAPDISINVNNTGTPATLGIQKTTFDGEKFVVDTVLREYNTNPNFRNSLGR